MHNAKSVPQGTQGIDGRHCDGMDLGDPMRAGKEVPAFVSRIFDSTRAWSDGEKQQTLFSVEQKMDTRYERQVTTSIPGPRHS